MRTKEEINTYFNGYYDKNREEIKAKSREYYAKNKEKIVKKTSAYAKKKKYNLSLDEEQALFDSQNGLCNVCNQGIVFGSHFTHIDHCHTSGKVRGLLCSHCNMGLGLFRDNKVFLQNAINYLEEHEKRNSQSLDACS